MGKKVKNRINYPFYIVDFPYINGKIIFIILSPFFPTTVECLFNWNSDIINLILEKENWKLERKNFQIRNINKWIGRTDE